MKKLLFLMLAVATQLCAQQQEPAVVAAQPIHEALVARIMDPVPQEIVAKQPPAPTTEVQPSQPAPKMIWISGYWEWMREKQDFIWVCGLWRLPPPDHTWLTGFWKDVKGGWTWVKGAWMPNPASSWVYSPEAPPKPQNENTGAAPGADSHWLSGYWNYEAPKGGWFATLLRSKGEFKWLAGSWQKFDPNWILEPAHWIWRPEGYLFVPTYWDWTLDVRGIVYDCKTQNVLEPKNIVQQLTFSYPDYSAEVCHYWNYQPQIWEGCECTPAWWGWQDWWSIPWSDQWWLWWWWLNPGYPIPPFIPIDIIDLIPPPPIVIIDIFDAFPPPIFILPLGVPSIDQWIDIIGRNNPPFVPPNDTTIIDQVDKLLPKDPKTTPPGGKGPGGKKPLKPVPPGDHPPASGTGKAPPTPKDTPPDMPKHPPKDKPSHPTPEPTPTPAPPPTAPIPEHPTDTPPTRYPPPTQMAPEPYPYPTPQPIPVSPQPYPPSDGGYYGGYYGGSYGSYGGGYYGGGYYGDGGHYGHHGHTGGGYYGHHGHTGGGYHGHHGHTGGGHHGHHGGGGGHHGGGGGGHHGGGHHR